MANIMSMMRVTNKPSRDGFDLQKTLAFTAKPGELLPVYNRVLMPGDKFRIDQQWRTRTAPLQTAAFTRFKEYYDWFFVPFDLLWNKYNVWSQNLKDQLNSATGIQRTYSLTDDHPYFNYSDIQYCIQLFEDGNDQVKYNEFGFDRSKNLIKLLHYLGYGDFGSRDGWHPADPLFTSRLSPFQLLAYQKIYADHYRFSQWEQSNPSSFNIDYIDGSDSDLHVPLRNIFLYAGDTYGYNPGSMLELRYANWNKDYFMGLLPNSQYGDEASVDLSSLLNPQVLTYSFYNSGNANQEVSTNSNGYLVAGTSPNWTINVDNVKKLAAGLGLTPERLSSAFTVLALRQAEALQKYKEIKQSNNLDFPSQVDAHFGVRPNNAYSRLSQRIGSFDTVIGIGDVDNNNITENSDGSINSARVAGKVNSRGGGKEFTFSTDVPGIIMCIYHVKPMLDYALPRIAPDVMKTRFTDYALPEFDRTGMQQVPLENLISRLPSEIGNSNVNFGDGLLGYAPIYLDYKTDIDEIKGAFYDGGLESWVAPISLDYVKNWFTQDAAGTYRFMGLNTSFFKVNPKVLNPIFATDMDSELDSDKFWCQCHFDISAVRPLDRRGLPY